MDHVSTVGVIWVDVRAGDVPPLDGGVDASTETLLTAGGHGQGQNRAAGKEKTEIN